MSVKRKGFTLIELLAVIVILAVIALIVTPVVTGIIKSAKEQADRRSAEGYVKAGENFYTATFLDQTKKGMLGTNVINNLEISNNKATGSLVVNSDGSIDMAIVINNKCYKKSVSQTMKDITVSDDITNCGNNETALVGTAIETKVLTAFPELELGTNGCKTLDTNKNYTYMGGCYLKGGGNIKEKFTLRMKEFYLVDDSLLNQLFDSNNKFIYTKYEELLVPIVATFYEKTVEELRADAVAENKTILEYDTGYTEELINNNQKVINNYLWYSGFLWRIMGINADGTIRLITEENVTAIPHNVKNNTNFEESYIDSWLNEYFYNNLKGTDIIVSNNFCQGAETTSLTTARITCTGGTILQKKVGLISIDEYNLAGNNASYLDACQYFDTISSYDSSTILMVSEYGYADYGGVSLVGGVRAIINVNSNTTITGGNGTLSSTWTNASSPYILNENKGTSITGLLNSIVTSGEYVKFANKTYRVVSKDSSKNTKLILDGYYQEIDGIDYKMAYGTNNDFTTTKGIGQKLNGDVLNYLIPESDMTNRNKIVVSYNWYRNSLSLGASYKVSLDEAPSTRRVQATVGLIRVGEMLSGTSYTILTKNGILSSSYNNETFYWTMTPEISESNVYNCWVGDTQGGSGVIVVQSNGMVRPVIVVNSNTTIIGGNGTPSSPYEI